MLFSVHVLFASTSFHTRSSACLSPKETSGWKIAHRSMSGWTMQLRIWRQCWRRLVGPPQCCPNSNFHCLLIWLLLSAAICTAFSSGFSAIFSVALFSSSSATLFLHLQTITTAFSFGFSYLLLWFYIYTNHLSIMHYLHQDKSK